MFTQKLKRRLLIFGLEERVDCAHGEWWLWCSQSVLEYAGL